MAIKIAYITISSSIVLKQFNFACCIKWATPIINGHSNNSMKVACEELLKIKSNI